MCISLSISIYDWGALFRGPSGRCGHELASGLRNTRLCPTAVAASSWAGPSAYSLVPPAPLAQFIALDKRFVQHVKRCPLHCNTMQTVQYILQKSKRTEDLTMAYVPPQVSQRD